MLIEIYFIRNGEIDSIVFAKLKYRGGPTKKGGGHGPPNFSNFIKLPLNFHKFFKKYMVPLKLYKYWIFTP